MHPLFIKFSVNPKSEPSASPTEAIESIKSEKDIQNAAFSISETRSEVDRSASEIDDTSGSQDVDSQHTAESDQPPDGWQTHKSAVPRVKVKVLSDIPQFMGFD